MPTLPRSARFGLVAGALALAAAGAGLAAPAGAQVPATLTVTPSTIAVGESALITATGCTGFETSQDNLFVSFSSSEGGPGGDLVPTDEDGTAVFDTGPAPEGAEGTYTILATCVFDDGETTEDLFDYDPAVLTVVTEVPPTTVAPTTSTTTAVEAVAVTPAFTG